MRWKILYTKHAQKDAKKIKAAGLKPQALKLLELLKEAPLKSPPQFEKLIGDLTGAYSRRINIQHRLLYQVIENEKVVKIIRMWTYYE